MYCKRCGKQLEDGASFCSFCGSPQTDTPDEASATVRDNDSGSIGWAVLGFFFTLVGFILWLVWMDDKPKCAKMAGLGALAGTIFGIVLSFTIVAIVLSNVDFQAQCLSAILFN